MLLRVRIGPALHTPHFPHIKDNGLSSAAHSQRVNRGGPIHAVTLTGFSARKAQPGSREVILGLLCAGRSQRNRADRGRASSSHVHRRPLTAKMAAQDGRRGKGGQILVEEISLVNPAPAGGSSQCRLSPLAHVLQPHHATASGDR
jgi:hypothetical protein